MIVKVKDINEGYFKASELRIENINKNKYSSSINETTKQMFAVNDINKLKQLLENEFFYEKIQDWIVERFYKNIQLGKLTAENFINGYNKMGHHGFIGVCKVLGVL